jgi:hypothetical protein
MACYAQGRTLTLGKQMNGDEKPNERKAADPMADIARRATLGMTNPLASEGLKSVIR